MCIRMDSIFRLCALVPGSDGRDKWPNVIELTELYPFMTVVSSNASDSTGSGTMTPEVVPGVISDVVPGVADCKKGTDDGYVLVDVVLVLVAVVVILFVVSL